MQKLYRVLSLLSPKEFKEFGLFIISPYCNKLNNIIKLYNEIKKYYPHFNRDRLSKEKLFSIIYPDEKYNDSRMRALFSHTLTLAENYLSLNETSSNNLAMRLNLIDAAKKKDDVSFYISAIKRGNDSLKLHEHRDGEYYNSLFRIIQEENNTISQFSNARKIQQEADALTVYYIINALRTFATGFNRQSSLAAELNTELAKKVEELAEMPPFKNVPAVQIHYALYRISRYHDENYFNSFMEMAGKQNVLKPSELYEAFHLLVNYCVLKILKGEKKYVKTKLELYKFILERKLWESEGNLNYVIFNNIVSSALENNQSDFAESFIKSYSCELNQPIRENMILISKARISYFRKDYSGALLQISKTTNYEDIFYKFAIKDLAVKCNYELKNYETIFSIIDSYRQLVKSNKLITENVKYRYKSYLKCLEELLKLKISPQKNKLQELNKIIETEVNIVNKDWLLNKANELK